MPDSSERTPTPQFSYQTTPSKSPVYTETQVTTVTTPPETSTFPTNASILPPEMTPNADADDTLAGEMPDDSGPTPQEASDMRSDIFIDASEAEAKPQPDRYPQTDDGFDLAMDLGIDFDMDLDMQQDQNVDFQFDPKTADIASADSDSLQARRTESFDFILDFDQDDSQDDTEVSEETTPVILDRVPYFERLMDHMVDYGTVKRVNNIMHKKMAEYFMKRNMEHVLDEIDHPDEPIIKYGKKLDGFATLKETDAFQRREYTAKVAFLRELRQRQCVEADAVFQNLLERETELGVGLINSKTGRELSERKVRWLISAQVAKAEEMRKLRLLHITIRNAITDKYTQIKALDKMGDNHTLMEFEQINIENENKLDKIENRDDELMHLRRRCRNAIQSLAHIREKISATEVNIKQLKGELQETANANKAVRERMNKLKRQRDFFRLESQRLKDDNGLLTKDHLLIDMENSIEMVETMKKLNLSKRDELTAGYQRLENLRYNYESQLAKIMRMGKKQQEDLLHQRQLVSQRRRGKTGRNKYLGDRPSYLKANLTCIDMYYKEKDELLDRTF